MPKTYSVSEDKNNEFGYEFRYDLNNAEHKQKVLDFEKELAGRAFDVYCMDVGLTTRKHPNYPDGSPIFQKDGGMTRYTIARRKFTALDSLRRLRFAARKEEHLAMLGGEECGDKPDSGRRCEYCYPFRLGEITKVLVMRQKNDPLVIDKKSDFTDEQVKTLFDAPVDSPVVDSEEEDPEELFANSEVCGKCGELKDECRCVNLDEIPF